MARSHAQAHCAEAQSVNGQVAKFNRSSKRCAFGGRLFHPRLHLVETATYMPASRKRSAFGSFRKCQARLRKLLPATLIVKREISISGELWAAFTAAGAAFTLAEIANFSGASTPQAILTLHGTWPTCSPVAPRSPSRASCHSTLESRAGCSELLAHAPESSPIASASAPKNPRFARVRSGCARRGAWISLQLQISS